MMYFFIISFQFFLVLAIIVVVELIIAITIFVMYTVPSVKDKFLRSTPENILRTAIQKYMDDSKLKIWIDLIQQEVCSSLFSPVHIINSLCYFLYPFR